MKHYLPLGSGTFRWENYGAFVWQWEKIHLIFTNSPVLVIELLPISVSSNYGSVLWLLFPYFCTSIEHVIISLHFCHSEVHKFYNYMGNIRLSTQLLYKVYIQMYRIPNTYTHIHTDRQTYTQSDRHTYTDIHTDRQTHIPSNPHCGFIVHEYFVHL